MKKTGATEQLSNRSHESHGIHSLTHTLAAADGLFDHLDVSFWTPFFRLFQWTTTGHLSRCTFFSTSDPFRAAVPHFEPNALGGGGSPCLNMLKSQLLLQYLFGSLRRVKVGSLSTLNLQPSGVGPPYPFHSSHPQGDDWLRYAMNGAVSNSVSRVVGSFHFAGFVAVSS